MSQVHPFFRYTTQVLAYRLGEAGPAPPQAGLAPATSHDGCAPAPSHDAPAPPDAPASSVTAGRARRILRAAGHGDARAVVLLGLGSGHLAQALAETLPPGLGLTVCSLALESVRQLLAAGRLSWWREAGPAQLVADTSVTALFCLLAGQGLLGRPVLVTANPEASPAPERDDLARLRVFLTRSRPAPIPPATATAPRPRVVLAAMLHPDEPDLPGFFAAVAGLGQEAVLLWDGLDVPQAGEVAARALDMPVRHLARRLDGDFAAQRNALLAACQGDWLVYLDADERPSPTFRQALAVLPGVPGLGGVFFPRLTLYPDAGQAKVGHGLWPDLQLRFFRISGQAKPHFVRPVHERLEGLAGAAGLALDAPIWHHSRLLKDDAAIRRKLGQFDTAGQGGIRHQLSRDYPSLPLDFFSPPAGLAPWGRVLLLPPMW